MKRFQLPKNKLPQFLAPFYPFAGVAFAWYCFIPNFRYLANNGVYRSQLVINVGQIIRMGEALHYSITKPKTKEWRECAFNEGWGYTDYIWPDLDESIKEGRAPTKRSDMTLEEYQIMKCGEKPQEGT